MLRAHAAGSGPSQRYTLVRHGSDTYARGDGDEFPLQCTDRDLLDLARHGYIKLYTAPPAVVLLPDTEETATHGPADRSVAGDADGPVVRLDIVQVYAWLAASLVGGLFALGLLTFTVVEIVLGRAPLGVASTVAGAISSVLTVAFFRQYDQSNARLRGHRTVRRTKDASDTRRPSVR